MNGRRLGYPKCTSFASIASSVLPAEEVDEILESLRGETDDFGEVVPLPEYKRFGGDEKGDDEVSSDEDMEEELDPVISDFEVPNGFEVLPRPANLPGGSAAAGSIDGLYVLMLWKVGIDLEWYLGMLKKFLPGGRRLKYDVQWEGDSGVRASALSLDNYYEVPEGTSVDGDGPEAGAWCFLRKE
jgi:hypothetical protein